MGITETQTKNLVAMAARVAMHAAETTYYWRSSLNFPQQSFGWDATAAAILPFR